MSVEILDLPELLERVQDDKELLIELLDIYVTDYQEKRILIAEAIEKNDFEQVKSIAHSLKGASGNISANQLRENFLKFEEMGKNNDFSNAQETIENMDQQFSALANRINEVKNELQS